MAKYHLRKVPGGLIPDVPHLLILDQQTTIIGRQVGVHLQLPSNMISRQHCVIFEQNGKYYIQDKNSTNGVMINNTYISSVVELNDGDCIVFGGEHQEMQENFKYYFERIGGPEKQNDYAQEKYSSGDTVQLYGEHMAKLQAQFEQAMNVPAGQPPAGFPVHSFPPGFPLPGVPSMPGIPQPVSHPSQLPPTVTPGFFNPQFSQTTPSGLIGHHFQPPQHMQPPFQPAPQSPQPIQHAPPPAQPAPQPVVQPVQPAPQPAPQPTPHSVVQPVQPAVQMPQQVSLSSTLPPLEKSASSPVSNRHSMHMSTTPATGNSGLSSQAQSYSAPLEAPVPGPKKRGSEILHSSASSSFESKKQAEDSPRVRTKTETPKKEESSGGWSLFKKNKSKLKQQKSAVASQSAPEEISAEDFDSKKSSNFALVKKLGVLTESFCETASVAEIDALIACKFNVKKLQGSDRSPFGVAIRAGNTKLAMRLVSHLGGEADCSYCEFTELPQPLIKMAQTNTITKLDISNNKLNSIPISDLENIKTVNISGNPLNSVPSKYRDNWLNYKKYVMETRSQAEEFKRIKVLVLGDKNTGKTSLVKNIFAKGKADIKKVEGEGLEIKEKQFGKTEFVFWNFGEALVDSVAHRLYLDTGCIYMITFNLMNVKISNLEYWLKSIKQNISMEGGALAFVIGTHSDEISDDSVIAETIEILKAKFPKHVFPFIVDFLPISSKSGSGVKLLLKKLKECKNHSIFNQEINSSWIQLKSKLQQLKQYNNKLYCTWLEYKQIAVSVGISAKAELMKVTQYLSSIGQIMYSKNLMIADDNLVYFDNLFIYEIISRVIALKDQWVTPGFLTRRDFNLVLTVYENAIHNYIIKLLCHYKIILYLPLRQIYFVNCLLSRIAPRSSISKVLPAITDDIACYSRVFKFQQLPVNLITYLIGSLVNQTDCKEEVLWEYGVVLLYHQCIYLFVEYLPDSYKISIELRFNKLYDSSKLPENKSIEKLALALWRRTLSNTRTHIESFSSGVLWDEYIPCIHCIRRGVYSEQVFLISYQDIINANENPYLYCHNIESSSRCIARTEVAPDITLSDLPLISSKQLQINEQIGEGGFGVVYKGMLENNLVAVKELSTGDSLDGNVYREFQIEAYIQSLLDHPNCVKLYGLTTNPPRMVLEFVSGGDLCNKIHPKHTPIPTLNDFPWGERFKIAFDIAKGIHHLQSQNPPIIHRDIRSPNIFMYSDGRALIGDFGLARQVNPEIGGMLGTWQWLAPECIDSLDSNTYDHRTDIYSVGVVFWELASCKVPFEEFMEHSRFFVNGKIKLQDLKRAIIEEHLRPTIPPETPPFFADLIKACWDVDISKRPSSKTILEILGRELGKMNEVEFELKRPPPSEMSNRLSSHLVTFSAPTIRSEVPISFTQLSHTECGKPRVAVACNNTETVWLGTSKGHIFVLKYSKEARNIQLVKDFPAHEGRIASLLYVPATKQIVTCSDDDGSIRLWNTEQYFLEKSITSMKTSRGLGPGQLLLVQNKVWVAASQQSRIVIFDSQTWNVDYTIVDQQLLGLSSFEFHKDMIWVGNEGKVLMYHSTSFEFLGSFKAHDTGRMPMYIISSSDIVWTASCAEIRFWDASSIDTLNLISEYSTSSAKLLCLKVSKATGRIFTGSFNGEFIMWDARTLKPMQEMVLSDDGITDVCILNDHVWCISSKGEIGLFNASQLHSKPKQISMRTIRTPGLGGSSSSITNRPSPKPAPRMIGRKKDKGTLRRAELDDSSVSNDEIEKKLFLTTLRKCKATRSNAFLPQPTSQYPPTQPQQYPPSAQQPSYPPSQPQQYPPSAQPQHYPPSAQQPSYPPSQPYPQQQSFAPTQIVNNGLTQLQLFASNGQLLPCGLFADPTTKVITLLQHLVPNCLKQMNVYQAGLHFEILWLSSNNTPTRFTPSDLSRPILEFGTQLLFNRIPENNLQSILVTHSISLYGIINADPNHPSAQIQID